MIDEAEATEDANANDASFAAAGTLRDVLDRALDNVDQGDASPERAAVWDAIRQAQAQQASVAGRLVLPLDAGAFVQLGSGIYGYASRLELPAWVPRRPRNDCVGRELAGTVIGIDTEASMVLFSPRLLALRQARTALGDGSRMSGQVVSRSPDGLVIDLGGARGFVPFQELAPAELLCTPEPDTTWHGYATAVTDTGVLLAHQPAHVRARRTRERRQRLAQLVPGSYTTGLVIRVTGDGALIAIEDGLLWGTVPRPALRSPLGQRLTRGSAAAFRILGRDENEPIQLALWPQSAP